MTVSRTTASILLQALSSSATAKRHLEAAASRAPASPTMPGCAPQDRNDAARRPSAAPLPSPRAEVPQPFRDRGCSAPPARHAPASPPIRSPTVLQRRKMVAQRIEQVYRPAPPRSAADSAPARGAGRSRSVPPRATRSARYSASTARAAVRLPPAMAATSASGTASAGLGVRIGSKRLAQPHLQLPLRAARQRRQIHPQRLGQLDQQRGGHRPLVMLDQVQVAAG